LAQSDVDDKDLLLEVQLKKTLTEKKGA